MPIARRNNFCPTWADEFIGEVMYRRLGQTETDHDLYYDHDAVMLFVVCSESRRVGPVLSNTHTRYTVDEFLDSNPGHRGRVTELLRARLGRALR